MTTLILSHPRTRRLPQLRAPSILITTLLNLGMVAALTLAIILGTHWQAVVEDARTLWAAYIRGAAWVSGQLPIPGGGAYQNHVALQRLQSIWLIVAMPAFALLAIGWLLGHRMSSPNRHLRATLLSCFFGGLAGAYAAFQMVPLYYRAIEITTQYFSVEPTRFKVGAVAIGLWMMTIIILFCWNLTLSGRLHKLKTREKWYAEPARFGLLWATAIALGKIITNFLLGIGSDWLSVLGLSVLVGGLAYGAYQLTRLLGLCGPVPA